MGMYQQASATAVTFIKLGVYIYLQICIGTLINETTVKNCNETCMDYRKHSQERGGKQVIFIIGLFEEKLIKKNCKYSHLYFPSIYL